MRTALRQIVLAIRDWNPRQFFRSGEQGIWLDVSDFSTMFQDSAGTTPVTAVEQPVGLIRDKSGRGNHATQATSTKRPVLSARVNLLTKTEVFSDAVWDKASRATITANNITDPLGGSTADKITETVDNGTHRALHGSVAYSNATYTASCYFKKGTRRWVWVGASVDNGAVSNTSVVAYFDLDTVAIGTSVVAQNSGAVDMVDYVSHTMSGTAGDWIRCSVTFTAKNNPISTGSNIIVGLASADGTISYAGSTSEYVYIWGASLVPADQAGLPYQRVNTATDYDTVGFKHYLKFDGVDDALATGTIDFTATDKMTVVAGVRKLSDVTNAILLELSASSTTTPGAFGLLAPLPTALAAYNARSYGSVLSASDVPAASYPAPITNVFTTTASISTDFLAIRLNGVVAASSAADQGTGNYGNYPLYIGSRAGTSLPFNGHIYSLIVRGAQSTDAQIVSAETYVNSKAGAY